MAKRDDAPDSLLRVRVAGLLTILGLVIFVTVADTIDGLFLGDHYHVDLTFYTFIGGLTGMFLLGEGVALVARRSNGRDRHDEP